MFAFFQRHIIAGIGLLVGPAIAIGSLILHAVALHEMGLPLEIWVAIGLAIFMLSVIGILIKWDQERYPANNAPADVLTTESPTTTANDIPRLTLEQKRDLLGEAAKLRTLMSSILISFTNGDRATEPLAHDLGEIFNRSGISPWYVYASPDSRSQSGIILCIKDLIILLQLRKTLKAH
jgi:hypothetical protein